MDQKSKIKELLLRSSDGFTAYEAIYGFGITRSAAYIYELRQEGWQIGMDRQAGHTARYWLLADPPGMTRPGQEVLPW
jgi:hypothetical protein